MTSGYVINDENLRAQSCETLAGVIAVITSSKQYKSFTTEEPDLIKRLTCQ